MTESKFVLPDAGRFTVEAADADRLIRKGDGDAALLYLYILRNRGELNEAAAAAATSMDGGRLKRALGCLGKLGLIRYGGAFDSAAGPQPVPEPADETPQYTAADIRRELENGSTFRLLADEVQKSLGKLLSSDDLMKLFGIYDNLGLPPEVILILVTQCSGEISERYGPGRKPTMRYIEKTAYQWERDGILTLDLAEEYLKKLAKHRGREAELLSAIGLGGHELTARGQEYVKSWVDMGFSADAVEIAYERTVDNTGKLVWKYMDSILCRWHSQNLHTAGAIEKYDTRKPESRAGTAAQETPAGPTAQDIERMKKILKQME